MPLIKEMQTRKLKRKDIFKNCKMEKFEVDNKIFGYHIFPQWDKVYVEIYYISSDHKLSNYPTEIFCLSKKFGRFWRKPVEIDYIKSKQWAEDQLKFIKESYS